MSTSRRTAKPPAPLKRPMTLDHLRAIEPNYERIDVMMREVPDPGLQEPGTDATEAERKAYDDAMAAYRAELDEVTVEMVVVSLPRKEMDDLTAKHPPTEEDIAQAKANGDQAVYHSETYVPALIHACLNRPGAQPLNPSREDVQFFVDMSPPGEGLRAFIACLNVNSRVRERPFVNGSSPTRSSGRR